MRYKVEPRRLHQRLEMALPLQVTCRETATRHWVEQTETQDITPVGARFTIGHSLQPGQLIHLTIRMPVQLRRYDHQTPNYLVWALVRFARAYKMFGAGRSSGSQYEIGVAFIGKTPPESFLADPTLRYELAPPEEKDGFWRACLPAPEDETAAEVFEVIIESLNPAGQVIAREETLTRNLTEDQAVIPTTLPIEKGQHVRLLSPDGVNVVTARVANRMTDPDGIIRVHLQFIGARWRLN
ncbi:MAG: hypothetical protein U0Z53_27810 [Blastocatellia bacterium]